MGSLTPILKLIAMALWWKSHDHYPYPTIKGYWMKSRKHYLKDPLENTYQGIVEGLQPSL